VDPSSGVEHVVEGRCTGRMAGEPRGERGFGYDPAFIPDEQPSRVPVGGEGGLTMAELTDEQKDRISHRGRAARALLQWLTSR
jgi:XTP/dITP diphosphohydrolase